MKEDRITKTPKSPGKITLKDYKDISRHAIGAILDHADNMGAEATKWEGIRARVDYKISQLEKKAKAEPKTKKPIQWICMSCNEIHTKRDTIFKCPTCKAENLERYNG